jgi:hypothetical protein
MRFIFSGILVFICNFVNYPRACANTAIKTEAE